MSIIRNVLGENLSPCSTNPMTGFHRDGYCQCGNEDRGQHIICVQVTDAFLEYSRDQGNDLITPFPEYNFPGLKAGDRWCLCLARWIESLKANVAPPVILAATHERVLERVSMETLKDYALDASTPIHSTNG